MEKKLEQLYELKKQGVITQKEFEKQKAKLLAGDHTVKETSSAKPGTLLFALGEFWKNYAGWGRATRSEYWWAYLFYSVLVPALLGTTSLVGILWSFVILVPFFCLTVRRLHDSNISAWNMLWYLVPIIGWILIIIYLCQPSTPENQFGKPRI